MAEEEKLTLLAKVTTTDGCTTEHRYPLWFLQGERDRLSWVRTVETDAQLAIGDKAFGLKLGFTSVYYIRDHIIRIELGYEGLTEEKKQEYERRELGAPAAAKRAQEPA